MIGRPDTLAAMVAARRDINGPGGALYLEEMLDALDAFTASPCYRIAALRADGLHVTPSGSPGFPRWTVTQETAPGVAVCIGHRYSEAAAVELAEATPL